MWGLSGVLLLRSSAAVLTPAHCCRGCPLAVRQCVVSSSSFPCLAWPGCGHNNIIIPMSSMACVHHHISLKYPSSANMSQRGRVGRRCCRGKGGKPRRLWWGKAESRGAYVVVSRIINCALARCGPLAIRLRLYGVALRYPDSRRHSVYCASGVGIIRAAAAWHRGSCACRHTYEV